LKQKDKTKITNACIQTYYVYSKIKIKAVYSTTIGTVYQYSIFYMKGVRSVKPPLMELEGNG